jgi:hypothetical protein
MDALIYAGSTVAGIVAVILAAIHQGHGVTIGLHIEPKDRRGSGPQGGQENRGQGPRLLPRPRRRR